MTKELAIMLKVRVAQSLPSARRVEEHIMQAGGIILCGGQSSRMGAPKAALPFGPELMLQRVYRLLSEVVQPIVVVSAADQVLPELPADALFAQDEQPSRGPLEGLRAGMKVMQPLCDLVYVTSCDVPLLQPGFVRRMLELAEGYEAAATVDGEFVHPLSAAYRTSLVGKIEQLLNADQLRPNALLKQINTRFVTVEEMRTVDPQLSTLRNLNRPEEYLAALREAGFE
ncbi:molybdenum cofactor guanylyltransferase [Anatilimnocola floriformis]|uniref:molybdenum cofactor guanylyltransferase n=1 Tax=Anatilimnocola floriformis TaxID=2948575 RepID=UPI0020C532FC|nr:molybdenum cofactor guanylyltransferase [Anatilimnocola floriformis]